MIQCNGTSRNLCIIGTPIKKNKCYSNGNNRLEHVVYK